MSLSDCPVEILREIYSHLKPITVKRLRSANKMLAAVGIEYLFREVKHFVTPSSVCRLLNLSSHSAIKRCVKSIHLCCYVLPQLDNMNRLMTPLTEALDDPSSSDYPNALSAYHDYHSLYSRQQKLLSTGQYAASLKVILSRLSNLEIIIINDFGALEVMPSNLDSLLHTDSDKEWFLTYNRNVEPQRDSAIFILGEVVEATTHLISAQRKRDFLIYYGHLPFGVSSERIDALRTRLERITRLKLDVPYRCHYGFMVGSFWEDDNAHEFGEAITSFLSATRNIKEPDVTLSPAIGSASIFAKDICWPHLNTLRLSSLNFETAHMLLFFKRHKHTLRVLGLANLWMDGTIRFAGWIRFFKRLQRESPLHLASFELENIFAFDILMSASWIKKESDLMPPDRAARYLMCGQKTNMRGNTDTISGLPCD